jgi:hypothetical protein
MTKSYLILMLAVLVGLAVETRAGEEPSGDGPYYPVPVGTRMYWRDSSGLPTDAVVDARPGETVFIQLMINSNPEEKRGDNFFLDADWGSDVVDTTPGLDGNYVLVDTNSYMAFRDGQIPGTTDEQVFYDAALDQLNITFAPALGRVPFPLADDVGGFPIEGLSPEYYLAQYSTPDTPDAIGLGIIAGFWVPIRSDAIVGSSTTFNVSVDSTLTHQVQYKWFEDLTETGPNAQYAMTINVVPEPATIAVMACGAAAMLRRRRR